MGENGMKGFMVMIILFMTLFLVLKDTEDSLLLFSAPHMPHPARLLFFSLDDGFTRPWKRIYKKKRALKKCYRGCDVAFVNNKILVGLRYAYVVYQHYRAWCKLLHGI